MAQQPEWKLSLLFFGVRCKTADGIISAADQPAPRLEKTDDQSRFWSNPACNPSTRVAEAARMMPVASPARQWIVDPTDCFQSGAMNFS